MKIYTLVFNETYSADGVDLFYCEEDCFNAMIKQIEEKTRVKIDLEKVKEAHNNSSDYEDDCVTIGKTYAQALSRTYCWEIFCNVIPDYQFGRSIIVNEFFNLFPKCKKFESLLYKIVGEYSDEDIARAIKDDLSVFINDSIIGECLYQYAAAELGGKTDEKSTSTIFEFFNSNDFVRIFNKATKLEVTDWADQTPIAHENWVYAMLTICNGDNNAVSAIRKVIDYSNHTNIFFNVEDYNNLLCENHRKKSSSLTDEQYNDIVKQLISEGFGHGNLNKSEVIGCFESTLLKMYGDMAFVIYMIAMDRGVDYVLDVFKDVVEIDEVEECGIKKWVLNLKGDIYDVAVSIDSYNRIKNN